MDEMIECPSPNFDDRDQAVSIVVLHYTGMEDAASAIARLRDPEARVSCHYLIAEDGQVLRMVPEEKRAWHAGQSYWRGVQSLNAASIGIEIVNPGHEFGYRPFTPQQMDALVPAARRHRRAPSGAARQCRRPFRHRAGAQAGSRRAVRLGPAGATPPRGGAADPGPDRSAVDRRRLPARARALRL